MQRFEECDESFVSTFLDVLENNHPRLIPLNFKLVYDLKKRIKQGRVVLASIELASAKLKFFSADDKAAEGYDYVIFVDKLAWEAASEVDRRRLLSHQLAHVFIDERGNPKLIGHDVEDFYTEMQRNADNPDWYRNLSELITSMYEQKEGSDG